MFARDIMTANVISVYDDSSIEDAARLLSRNRISGLPVLNHDGALVGLITEYDLISKQGRKVSDIMSRNVISVAPDTDSEALSVLLTSQHIRRVPVVDHGKVVGIVSRSDLVRQIAMRWVCDVCGEMINSSTLPETCPRCGATDSFFHDVQPPGM